MCGKILTNSANQSLDLQNDALLQAGCEKIFSDVATGARTQRPGLDEAINFCRAGDTLVVWRLDRMGRSISHLINTVRELDHRGIEFQSLIEAIDTTTSGGKLIFHIFGALAEFERDLIRERVQAGRAHGRKGGRPPLPHKKVEMMKILYQDKNLSIGEICKQLNVGRSTLFKYVSKNSSV